VTRLPRSEITPSLRFLSRVPAFLRHPFSDAEARASSTGGRRARRTILVSRITQTDGSEAVARRGPAPGRGAASLDDRDRKDPSRPSGAGARS